jgi:hypothetical protein
MATQTGIDLVVSTYLAAADKERSARVERKAIEGTIKGLLLVPGALTDEQVEKINKALPKPRGKKAADAADAE